MKINILSLEHEIDFERSLVQVLEIEDRNFFASITYAINELCNGSDITEKIILLENDNVVDFSKNCIVFFDFFNFDYNQKRIITSLYKQIESIYQMDTELRSKLDEVGQILSQNVNEIISDFDFEIDYKFNPAVTDYIKLLNFKINFEQFDSPVNKIIGILEIINTFNLNEVIIFVNLKKFLVDKEIIEVYKFCNYKKIRILLVEFGLTEELFDYELKLQIDSDFFETMCKGRFLL